MTITTEETWSVNGVVLNTLAYNIEVLTGRELIPPRRGQNIIIPYKPGRLFVPKVEDERPLDLAMWVADSDVDGNIASTDQARRAQLRDNTETLKALFGVYNTLLTLERKIRLGSGLKTWTAHAECVNTIPFTWDRGFAEYAKFVAQLIMPDPYWYDGATKKL